MPAMTPRRTLTRSAGRAVTEGERPAPPNADSQTESCRACLEGPSRPSGSRDPPARDDLPKPAAPGRTTAAVTPVLRHRARGSRDASSSLARQGRHRRQSLLTRPSGKQVARVPSPDPVTAEDYRVRHVRRSRAADRRTMAGRLRVNGPPPILLTPRLRARRLGPGGGSAAAGSTLGTAPPSSPPTDVAAASSAAGPEPARRSTETDWGRIWDTLPNDFPRSGLDPAEETATGPASATLAVDRRRRRRRSRPSYRPGCQRARFTTSGASGPLENGGLRPRHDGSAPRAARSRSPPTPTGGLMTVRSSTGPPAPAAIDASVRIATWLVHRRNASGSPMRLCCS